MVAWSPSGVDGKKATQRCKCGNYGFSSGGAGTDAAARCRCTSAEIDQYLGRVSGPLMDRIDLHVQVRALPADALTQTKPGESSADIRARVLEVRGRQAPRLKELGLAYNAQLRHRQLREVCKMSDEAAALLKSAIKELALSARAYDKILKVSRTVADLAASDTILPEHLAEAIQYRSLDRQF